MPNNHSKNSFRSLIFFLTCLVLLNYSASFVNIKIDCTEENKYTLSKASKQLCANLSEDIYVKILLTQNLPSEFKKLKNSIQYLLEEMNPYANYHLRVTFIDPLNFYNDSLKNNFLDTLYMLGIRPTNITISANKKGTQEKKTVFPAAILQYQNKVIGINFLAEKLINNSESLNAAEALLEYKFTNAIEQLTKTQKHSIAYSTGHQEPLGYNVIDLFNSLYPSYYLDTINLKTKPFINHNKYDLLLIVKPIEPFSDKEKLKIDQFVLHGGKVMFVIDNVFAEMQQLAEKKQMVAQNLNLQLDDLLFHYGTRLEYNIIQDLQCDKLPIQIGWNGDKPQLELLPWYYYPLFTPNPDHVITKNLDYVLSNFASSMAFNTSKQIKANVLLSSSSQSKRQGTPSIVSFETFKTPPDANLFMQSNLPIAALLESTYTSLYANRLTDEMKNEYENNSLQKIIYSSSSPNKIIVIADGDIVLNPVTQKDGPMMMGMNPYTKFQFANKLFIQNCIEYLVSKSQIIENRNKGFALRLLDKKRVSKEKTFWQGLNIIVPILLALVLYIIYVIWRWLKYQA